MSPRFIKTDSIRLTFVTTTPNDEFANKVQEEAFSVKSPTRTKKSAVRHLHVEHASSKLSSIHFMDGCDGEA